LNALRHIIALLLLALWLPATQHCGLEAAGFIAEGASHFDSQAGDEESPCGHGKSDCATDPCKIVESGTYKSALGSLKVPPPSFALCDFIQRALRESTPVVVDLPAVHSADPYERPRDCGATWHFVERAAPLSRAPSLSPA
jgi:hypothetical protein